MIAKIIVHGPTRGIALRMLSNALCDYRVSGTVTNLEFLTALSRHEGFASGQFDTHLIPRDLDKLILAEGPDERVVSLAALCALGFIGKSTDAGKPAWSTANALFGFRHWSLAQHTVTLEYNEEIEKRTVTILGGDSFVVEWDEQTEQTGLTINITANVGNEVTVTVGKQCARYQVIRLGAHIEVTQDGRTYRFMVPEPSYQTDANAESGDRIFSPMPGSVLAVEVCPGDSVNTGDKVAVIEAMKMEHTVTSPRDAIVGEVLIEPGEQVQDGGLLMTLEPAS